MGRQLGIRIKLPGGAQIGPGKIAVLKAVDEHGAIAAAARALGMSYRRAWRLVDSLNHSFDTPLVETSMGGIDQGGATLTALGRRVVALYERVESESEAVAAPWIAALEQHARPAPEATVKPPRKRRAGR